MRILFILVFLLTIATKALCQQADTVSGEYINAYRAVNRGINSGQSTIVEIKNDSLYNKPISAKYDSLKKRLKAFSDLARTLINEMCIKLHEEDEVDSSPSYNVDRDIEDNPQDLLSRTKYFLSRYNGFVTDNFTSDQMDSLKLRLIDLTNPDLDKLIAEKTPYVAIVAILNDLYLPQVNMVERNILEYWINSSK